MSSLATDRLSGAMKSAASVPALATSRLLELVSLFAGVFNAVNSGAVTWIKFHGLAFVSVWGAGGVMVNSLPSAIIPTLLMVVLGTHATRRRLSALCALSPGPAASLIQRLPANLARRASVLAFCMAIAAFGITYLVIASARVTTMSFSALMVMQLIQAFLIGACLGPLIVARALCEAPHRALPDPD